MINLNDKIIFLIVAIIAIVVIVQTIVNSRRPIITYTKNPTDPITQRIIAIKELSENSYLSASQIENLIKLALENKPEKIEMKTQINAPKKE